LDELVFGKLDVSGTVSVTDSDLLTTFTVLFPKILSVILAPILEPIPNPNPDLISCG
jgi:hypothetical protein